MMSATRPGGRAGATDIAQPAIGAACVGMLRLLRSLGLEPDIVAGHSYGELVALHAAGALDARDLAGLSAARGRLMIEAGRGDAGAMAAVLGSPDAVDRLVDAVPGVRVANFNGPRQTVIAGPVEALDRLLAARRRGRYPRTTPSGLLGLPHADGRRAREPFAAAGPRTAPASARPAGLLESSTPRPIRTDRTPSRTGWASTWPVRSASPG